MRHLGVLLIVLLASSGVLEAQTTTARRLSVGTAPTTPGDSSTRLANLATSGGTDVLFVNAAGDVRRRLLVASDIPTTFTQRQIAEAISGVWSFTNGLTGALPVAGVIASTAQTGIPASTGSGVAYLAGGYGSPVSGRLFIGDGTGWQLRFSTRSGGTTVDRAHLYDTGTLETRGDLIPMQTYSGNVGYDSRKWLAFAGAEMRVETIVAQERIATIGGRLTVGNSNYLTRDLSAGTASTTAMCVKYNSFKLHVGGIELGSKIYMERLGQFEAFVILDTATPAADPSLGDYCYAVARNQDGSGQNAWNAGDGIIDTGKVGDGFIDLYAFRSLRGVSEVGPAIQFNRRTDISHNGWSTYSAIGHLNGICGNVAGVWGAVFGNCAGGLHLQADATYGIRMMDAANTSYASWDMAGTVRSGIHAPGYPNVVITPSAVQLGLYGATPTIELQSSTGNAYLNGALYLQGGGDIVSTGNFALGVGGLRMQRSTSTSLEPGKSVRWTDTLGTTTATIGQLSNNALHVNSTATGASAGVRLSVGAMNKGLFITSETDGVNTDIVNIVAQNIVAALSWNAQIQFVPVMSSPGATTRRSFIGTPSNRWTQVHADGYYTGADAGLNVNIYAYSWNGAAQFLCQQNYRGGLLVAHNCGVAP